MENKQETQNETTPEKSGEVKPNENAGFYFSSFLKISDPQTKEVLIQMRGDN